MSREGLQVPETWRGSAVVGCRRCQAVHGLHCIGDFLLYPATRHIHSSSLQNQSWAIIFVDLAAVASFRLHSKPKRVNPCSGSSHFCIPLWCAQFFHLNTGNFIFLAKHDIVKCLQNSKKRHISELYVFFSVTLMNFQALENFVSINVAMVNSNAALNALHLNMKKVLYQSSVYSANINIFNIKHFKLMLQAHHTQTCGEPRL